MNTHRKSIHTQPLDSPSALRGSNNNSQFQFSAHERTGAQRAFVNHLAWRGKSFQFGMFFHKQAELVSAHERLEFNAGGFPCLINLPGAHLAEEGDSHGLRIIRRN
jgi:hypothetical protein